MRLRWLQGRVPAARPVAFADEDGAAWLLTTGVVGRTGDAWLDHDPALLPVIVAAFARFLTQLHALPVDDCPFEAGAALRLAAARRRVGAGEVDVEDFADDHLGWDAERMLAHTEALYDADLHQRVVTHGDFSLGNLLMDERGDVTGCIDVGLLGVADPYQDIAILCANLGELDAAAERAFLDAIGVASPLSSPPLSSSLPSSSLPSSPLPSSPSSSAPASSSAISPRFSYRSKIGSRP